MRMTDKIVVAMVLKTKREKKDAKPNKNIRVTYSSFILSNLKEISYIFKQKLKKKCDYYSYPFSLNGLKKMLLKLNRTASFHYVKCVLNLNNR